MARIKNIYLNQKLSISSLFLYTALLITLATRLYNLNHNTPFNDEAIYIVVGSMGIMENDFFTYGANNWMGGLPVLYPVFSALFYQTGGIVASRILNVVFSVLLVEEVFIFTKRLNLFDKYTNLFAAFISALLAGISGIGAFTGRIATYDMPSFFFLMVGINALFKSVNYNNGKYYFIASVSLLLSFFIKMIVGIYYPLLVILSFGYLYKYKKENISYWFKYFFLPLSVGILIFVIVNFNGLRTFYTTEVVNETASIIDMFRVVREDTGYIMLFWLFSIVILLLKKKTTQTFVLSAFGLLLMSVHILFQRYTAFDKHLYLTVLFVVPLIGYAFSTILTDKRILSYLLKPALICVMLMYFVNSFEIQKRHEESWPNTQVIDRFFVQNVSAEDRVLTENGASTILSLYKTVHPLNITTFDWINYSGYQGEKGYVQSIQDKYFKYIELNDVPGGTNDLENIVRSEMEGRYKLIFTEKEFEIYERI